MNEPLPDDMLAIIRRDDERIPDELKLADPTRVLWDRHCLLAEVERLRAELARRDEQIATVEQLEALPHGQWLIGWDHFGYGHIGHIEHRPELPDWRGTFWPDASTGCSYAQALEAFGPLTVVTRTVTLDGTS
jgi:hypothetical protein